MEQKTKNSKIRESYIKTKNRRKSQDCFVFKIKIQDESLTKEQKECLKMQFVEAKWIANAAIAWSNESDKNKIWNFKVGKNIIHKDKDLNDIESVLSYLGSQAKQSVIQELVSNIRTLSTLKNNGKKTGKLKFKKEISSINLKQYGNSYKIISKRKIKIQNIPGKIKVNGLKQIINSKNKIRKDIEFANAKLLNTAKGFYLVITCFKQKTEKLKICEEIGLDFGCSTSLTLSNGKKFNVSVQESDRLKRLQRKMSHQIKGSKGRYKTLLLIKKEYQKMSNKKLDLANKIVHEVLQYENIYMQDENLSGWKKQFGKTIQHSCLGTIKSKIKNKAKFILGRFEPTTKMCYNCGQIHEIPLNQRIFKCDCGIEPEDRDIHAAKNMIVLSKIKLGQGLTEFTPVEINTTGLNPSMIDEAGRSDKIRFSECLHSEDATSLV